MNLDELISELEEVREEHGGDLSIVIPSMQAGELENIEVGELEIDLIGTHHVKKHGLY